MHSYWYPPGAHAEKGADVKGPMLCSKGPTHKRLMLCSKGPMLWRVLTHTAAVRAVPAALHHPRVQRDSSYVADDVAIGLLVAAGELLK